MSLAEDSFQALDANGKEVYDAMMAGVRSNIYAAPPEISRPISGYQTHLFDADPVPFGTNQQHMFEEAELPLEGYSGVQVYNVPAQHPGPYLNYVHKEGKVILCWANFATDDTLGEERLHWSDIMAASCSRIMAAVNARNPGPRHDMVSISAICRLNVVNPTTAAVVARVHSQRPRTTPGPLTLRKGEPDFFTLLGTQNGKGLARMLGSYPRMFGQKVITSAWVDPEGMPNICWALEKLEAEPAALAEPATPSGPISRKDARKAKKRQERLERTI